MKALKPSFVATLTRYNFGDPILGNTKEFENYPTEAELLGFLNDCNTKHVFYKDFHTKIVVDKVYTVINVPVA